MKSSFDVLEEMDTNMAIFANGIPGGQLHTLNIRLSEEERKLFRKMAKRRALTQSMYVCYIADMLKHRGGLRDLRATDIPGYGNRDVHYSITIKKEAYEAILHYATACRVPVAQYLRIACHEDMKTEGGDHAAD